MNYAESLTYWYLRLNGFFPVTNFVLHRPYGKGQSTDCDVLAIRPIHAAETISNDVGVVRCDEEFFTPHGIDLTSDFVAVIAQVKSGEYSNQDVARCFDKEQLFYCLHRLGVLEPDAVNDAVEKLLTSPLYRRNNLVIAKLLVDTEKHRKASYRPAQWLQKTLDDVEKFITNRFEDYAEHKSGARMHFDNELIQYMAWQSGKK